MVYSSDASKWRAYQFLDPFAAGSFVVCNKNNNVFCRPDCDSYPHEEVMLDVEFLNDPAEALKLGFAACDACVPTSPPKFDVKVLAQAVDTINASIGFYPPPRDNDDAPQPETSSPSKDEADHLRLVDLACRHLVIAAAQSVLSSDSKDSDGKKNRRRRGGVLGFKELAAKSKLSAWHFHRVFKNVTCLTPKTYGSKCVEYLTNHRDGVSSSSCSSANSSTTSLNSYATPMLSTTSLPLPRKRSRDEIEVEMPYKKASFDSIFTPKATPESHEKSVSFELPELAWAAPQVSFYNPEPQSLFTHVKPMADEYSPEISSLDTMSTQMPTFAMDPGMPVSDNYLDVFDHNLLQNSRECEVEPGMWLAEPLLPLSSDPYSWNISLDASAQNFA